ncbi:hypothetical protein DPSP01_008994 [Paraphaeosphaeria sporulosa]
MKQHIPIIASYPKSIHSEQAEILDESPEQLSNTTHCLKRSVLEPHEEENIRAQFRRDSATSDACAGSSTTNVKAGLLVNHTHGFGSSTTPIVSEAHKFATM